MKLALFGRKTDIFNLRKLNNLIHKFKEHGNVELCFYAPFYESLKENGFTDEKYPLFTSFSDLPEDLNLFLSLGGDGTFLESLTFIRDREIPVAGINSGRLGFLTTAQIDGEDDSWIGKLLSGNYAVEQRSVLSFDVEGEACVPDDFYKCALNEITLQRRSPIMLEISISVDGRPLPVYIADGILIGSATGSTAYSLSIGGPIVTPDSKVLIIAPIAPHNLNVRPIIVPETSKIEISYNTRGDDALLTADNRFFVFPKHGKLTISKSGHPLKSISINNSFIEALNQKLLWGEDKRNMLK